MSNIGFKVNVNNQNLIKFSEEIGNPIAWNEFVSCAVTLNAIDGPFANTKASYIYGNAGAANFFAQNSLMYDYGYGPKVCSIYAKANTASIFTFNSFHQQASGFEVNTSFDLSNGTITSQSEYGQIIPVGNDWYRCVIYVPAKANLSLYDWWCYRIWPNGRGNGASTGCYFYGAQCNNGTVLLPYTKTTASIVNDYYHDSPDIGDLLVSRDIFTEGGLWGWGHNITGNLGDNSTINKSSPVQTICGGNNWKSISTGYSGYFQSAFIKSDGTLWTCGYNNVGQLGDNTQINRSSPVQTICGGNNWKQVSGGVYLTAAIKTDGTLWTCGANSSGQLGDNSTISKSSPVQTICGGNNWKQVSCGGGFILAIKTDGTLWGWGENNYGKLGDNSTTNKSSPVQTIAGGNNWKCVSELQNGTVAIKTDGTLWAWGINSSGQLGDNSTIDRSSPIQTICGGNNWKEVSCGDFFTFAIKTDGTLWLWGGNSYGQLGDNSSTHKSSPIQTIAGGTNWKIIASNTNTSIGIKTDGTLWTWGLNGNGQLGDNTIINKSSPVQTVAGGNNWKSVEGFCSHTFAIKDLS